MIRVLHTHANQAWPLGLVKMAPRMFGARTLLQTSAMPYVGASSKQVRKTGKDALPKLRNGVPAGKETQEKNTCLVGAKQYLVTAQANVAQSGPSVAASCQHLAGLSGPSWLLPAFGFSCSFQGLLKK